MENWFSGFCGVIFGLRISRKACNGLALRLGFVSQWLSQNPTIGFASGDLELHQKLKVWDKSLYLTGSRPSSAWTKYIGLRNGNSRLLFVICNKK